MDQHDRDIIAREIATHACPDRATCFPCAVVQLVKAYHRSQRELAASQAECRRLRQYPAVAVVDERLGGDQLPPGVDLDAQEGD
jgi:hypothetical protein